MEDSLIESVLARIGGLEQANQRVEQDNERLVKSLNALARQERKGRRTAYFLIIACAFIIVFGKALISTNPKKIEAEEFFIHDKDGKKRAVLGTNKRGEVFLDFYTAAGRRLASLADHSKGAASLELFDGDGKVRSMYGVAPDGSAGLDFFDEKGRLLIMLTTARKNLMTGLLVFDPEGHQRASAGVGKSGTAGFTVYDKPGRIRTQNVMDPDGAAGLWVYDRSDNLRSAVLVTKENHSGVEVIDRDGKQVFQTPFAAQLNP
jgi:hypothetical protein